MAIALGLFDGKIQIYKFKALKNLFKLELEFEDKWLIDQKIKHQANQLFFK